MEYIDKPFYHFDVDDDLAILAILKREAQGRGGGINPMGLVRNLTVDTSTAQNSGAVMTTLHSFTLGVNFLPKNKDYLNVWYGGTYAANANNKVVTATAGGTLYELTGGIQPGASGWSIAVRIVRISAIQILVSDMILANDVFADSASPSNVTTFGDSAFAASRNRLIAVPDLSLNTLTLSVSGQGVANGDITQNLSIIEIVNN